MPDRPKIEFRPVDRRASDSIWLQEHRRNVRSQSGEDGLFEKIFEIIGPGERFVVDFGAGDGENLSNSYNLVRNHDWSAVLIEPEPSRYAKLKRAYSFNRRVHAINDIVGFDEGDRLDAHLATATLSVPERFDLLSIDVDGCDVHIWRDIKGYRPRVVCIEFNHFAPLDVYMVQPRDLSLNIGSSLLATAEIGRELGYELVATTDMNAIFVDRDLFPAFKISDNSVEAMHFLGRRETKIVHSYDGTLFLAGLSNNPWKGFQIDEERIQVLPSNMRQWKFDGRIWPTKKL